MALLEFNSNVKCGNQIHDICLRVTSNHNSSEVHDFLFARACLPDGVPFQREDGNRGAQSMFVVCTLCRWHSRVACPEPTVTAWQNVPLIPHSYK